jgi:hypothetical protein
MTQIHFHFTQDTLKSLTTDDYEAFERANDGELRIYRLRPVMARYMVDEQLQPIPYNVAYKSLNMPMQEFIPVMQSFFEALNGAAVPNGNGRPSKSLSEVAPVVSPSLGGSQP